MSREEAVLLAVFSLGAFFVPLVSRRLLLPLAVGEISFGLVLGYIFQGLPESMPMIKFLSELGFLLLMYLAGLEVDVQAIRSTSARDLLLYGFFFTVLGAASWTAAAMLGQDPFYGLIYFTTAVGLLFPVLRDAGLLKTAFGQRLLVLGSIGEVLSLMALSCYIFYISYGVSFKTVLHFSELVLFFALSYVIALLLRLFVWWHPRMTVLLLQTGDSAETGIRSNLLNLFLFVSLAALLNMKLVIGAFFGGMLFALLLAKRDEITQRLNAFGYGFLIPLFFIEVGLRFSLRDFFNGAVLLQAAQICGVILCTRAAAAIVLIFTRFRARELPAVPFSLSFPLTLIVALATIGLQEGSISSLQATSIIAASMLSALAYPCCFKLVLSLVRVSCGTAPANRAHMHSLSA